MGQNLRSVIYLLTLLVLSRLAWGLLPSTYPAPKPLSIEASRNDPEALYALGATVSITELDQYALELIPGISTTRALLIWGKLPEICQQATDLPLESRYEAWTVVKGIGVHSAGTLSRYIQLPKSDLDCPPG